MHLLDLPFPALQCVFENMTVAVGLYKAVRLRLVSHYFDEEVSRVIFETRTFKFDGDRRPRNVGSKCVSRDG